MGGQRSYTEKDIKRLRFIMDCRANGMKLECIERFLQFRDNPSLGTPWLLDRVNEYLDQVQVHRENLDRVAHYLKTIKSQLECEILKK